MSLESSKANISNRIKSFILDENSDDFTDISLELFKFQFSHIQEFQTYCKSLKVSPNTIKTEIDIPPIGLNVFKEATFFAGSSIAKTFHTSGTSGKGRGASTFDDSDLALMQTSILENCKQSLFSDNLKTRFLMIVPSPKEAPDIIMAYGMNFIAKHWGLEPALFAVSRGNFLGKEAISYIQKAISDNVPLTIIGGSFGFVNFIDNVISKIPQLPLPRGSRLLDAGGFKGRSRELNRLDFLDLTSSFFKVPRENCFNLYGLTELGSQFQSRGDSAKKAPHWTRVRICDPLTLKDVQAGETGVAILYDLANVAKPFVILTDDLAIKHDDGFELLGRASGSAPRGCSLSLEEVRS